MSRMSAHAAMIHLKQTYQINKTTRGIHPSQCSMATRPRPEATNHNHLRLTETFMPGSHGSGLALVHPGPDGEANLHQACRHSRRSGLSGLRLSRLARGLDSGHGQLTGATARTPFPGIITHARPRRGRSRPWLASAFRLPVSCSFVPCQDWCGTGSWSSEPRLIRADRLCLSGIADGGYCACPRGRARRVWVKACLACPIDDGPADEMQPSRASRLPCREICLPAGAMRMRGWV